jgi:hypothetical protein
MALLLGNHTPDRLKNTVTYAVLNQSVSDLYNLNLKEAMFKLTIYNLFIHIYVDTSM